MEVSGRKKNKLADVLCDVCLLLGKNMKAEHFCADCNDYFCENCCMVHKVTRYTRNHKFLDSGNMPKQKMESYGDSVCSKHSGKGFEYICEDHNSIFCSVCVTLDHKNCNLLFIDDIATDFDKTPQYKTLIDSIASLTKQLQEMKDMSIKKGEKLQKSHGKFIRDVKAFRKEINQILDTIEGTIVKEADDLKEDHLKLAVSDTAMCDNILVELNIASEKMREQLRYMQHRQLVISVKETQIKVKEYDAKLVEMAQGESMELEFVQNENLLQSLRSFTTMGDIKKLVRHPNPQDIKEREKVCQEASNAFKIVDDKINLQDRYKIKVIGEMIADARVGATQSAVVRIRPAEDAYIKYVLKHLEEKERVATKGKEPRVSVKEPVDSVISSDAGNMNRHTPWTRDDVIGQFKQLYDVDWKSAYDEMRKGGKGVHKEETCEDLYYITKTIYHLSKDVVSETVKLMDMACKDIIHQQQTFTEKTENKNQDEAKGLLLIFIRQNYGLVHRRLQQVTMEFLKKYKDYPKTLEFGERCATVTWWMQVQDPPMSITYVKIGETCKPETYDLSGQTGNRIVYRIMPALLTDSNGVVLVKGRMATQ